MTTYLQDLAAQATASPSLCLCEGLFHVEMPHPVGDGRLRVALHGIRTFEEANKALWLLTRPCAPAEAVALRI